MNYEVEISLRITGQEADKTLPVQSEERYYVNQTLKGMSSKVNQWFELITKLDKEK